LRHEGKKLLSGSRDGEEVKIRESRACTKNEDKSRQEGYGVHEERE
jgi:hypothetical protein